jgi:hypothetical protein
MDISLRMCADDLLVGLTLNQHQLILGAVGVGKTDVARQTADVWAKQEYGLAKCPIIDRRVSQFLGYDTSMPMPNTATGLIDTYQPGWLPRVERDGPVGVLLLDEYTDGKPDTLAAINQLVLEGRLGDYVFPDENMNPDYHWRIIGTGNRASDKAHAQKISRAASNRWTILNIAIDVDAWIDWATANLLPVLVAYVQTAVMQLRGKDADITQAIHIYPPAGTDAVAFKTPRSLARCDKYFRMASQPNDTQLRRLLAHNVGQECADDIMNFLVSYRLAPNIAAILADPVNGPMPRGPSENFAVAIGLVSRLTLANLSTINVYVKRLAANYQATFWSNALAKDVDKDTRVSVYQATPEHVAYLIASRDADADAA